MARVQLQKSKEAFLNKDHDLADEIFISEKHLNNFELRIDRDCENIFALHNPVASRTAGPATLDDHNILINKNSVEIYPNPVLNTLHIKTNYLEEITLELYSLTGTLLVSNNRINHEGSIDLQLDYLAKGIYILKGISNRNSLVFQKKIIK